MWTNLPDTEDISFVTRPSTTQFVVARHFPAQSDLDAAYAIRIFLQHHPSGNQSLSFLVDLCGVPEQRLKAAFLYQFNEHLEDFYSSRRR
jgi:hypothetical protein